MKRAGLQAHSAESEAALRFFLNHVVRAGKRARYLDLIARSTSRRKFLDTLYHELESHLDTAKRIDVLSPEMLRMSGFRFQPGGDRFGEPVDSLANVVSSFDESFLMVSTDGRVGIHGPESCVNRRAYYAV